MNILILHVRKNKLPSHVLNALLAEHNLTVITEPGHEQVYPSDVSICLVADARNIEIVRKVAYEQMAIHHFDYIITPFELAQTVGAYLRSYFGLPGTDFDTANNFANKYVMKRRFVSADIPTAPHGIAYGLADVARVGRDIGWPVVIKPIMGGGSMDVVILDDATTLADFMESPAAQSILSLDIPLIVERFYKLVAEYHCDGIVHNGEVQFAAPATYLSPMLNCPNNRNGSYFLSADHPDYEVIKNLHARAAIALGLKSGVTHMEFLRTEEGILAGEIACRPAGGGIPDAIKLGFGIDIWQAYLDTSLGKAPKIEPVPQAGIVINYQLPVKSGLITHLSSRDELAALPNVLRVDMLKHEGDVVPEKFNSSYSTGQVYLTASSEDDIEPIIEQIVSQYRLEVRPVVSLETNVSRQEGRWS
ncbi:MULTISPECIES: ATP-grasp domain-containing protein [Aeromonas]|uniref:hypothetical protein n=1 Tax=Aeromonas TaxID=642 RepID=UPI0019348AB8|nr:MULTISPECIES: hypothetical protein [Aeromonas]MBM0419444.1 hypothetical protein [Aeromonas veronii]MBW3791235.1 hypothetical protein [Aeromonas veronii]UXB10078.1 hypothetical protein GP476_00765 [Aeromonas dhakensis]